MLLHINPYSIKEFSHHLGNKMLVAEASTMGWAPGQTHFSQLYDDACDVGLAIYNERTGSTTYWHTAAEVRDSDGDLTTWVLLPTGESCRKHPGVQNYVMHILND